MQKLKKIFVIPQNSIFYLKFVAILVNMSDDEDSDTPKKVLKSAYDVQRMKLEKLMKNPVKIAVVKYPF